MATAINKTTLEVRSSVHTPDYPTADWIINPDLDSLSGIAKKYWKIDGSLVVEMNQTEKDAVDAAELAAAKTTRKSWLDSRTEVYLSEQYPDGLHLDFANMHLNAKPNLKAYVKPYITWRDSVYADRDSKKISVNSQTTVNDVNAIVLDESTLTTNDPAITISDAESVKDSQEFAILFGNDGTLKTTTYKKMKRFVFPGTDVTVPEVFRVNCDVEGTATGSVKLYDKTNKKKIAEITGISGADQLVETSSLSNLPTNRAVFEIQCKSSDKKKKLYIASAYLTV